MDQGRAFGKGLWALAVAASAGYSAVLLREGLSRITHRNEGGLLGPSQLEGFHLVRGILNLCFLVAMAVYLYWLIRCREESPSLSALLKKAAPFLAIAFIAVALIRVPLHWVIIVLAPLSIAASWQWRR